MPVTKVKSPDGRIIQVRHPEGASQQDIIAYAKKQPVKAEEAPTLEDRRDMIAGGTLQFGPFDTGIETPQWLDEGLAGMGRRMTEIGSLGTHKPDPLTDQLLDDSIPATVGSIATDVGAMALGGGALKAGAALPGIGKSLGAAGTALTAPTSLKSGMLAAGAYGAATDPDRLEGGIGAALGQGIGHGVSKFAGKVASPHIKQSAREIIDSGGTATPGEMVGGAFQRAEDAATSMPVLGDAIKGAKKRSLQGYNKSVINDALEVIGKRLDESTPAGREAISEADALLSNQYDAILETMNVRLDPEFITEVNSLDALVKELPKFQQNQFARIIKETIVDPFDNPNSLLLGKTFKESDSRLRHLYKKHQKSSDLATEKLGDALRTVHKSLLDMGRRQNPEAGKALARTDQAYAMMGRVSEAAIPQGANEGLFTPSHMLNAVRKNTSKKQFAAGKGFNQAQTEAAKDMLASTVPDSGTAMRALVNLGFLGTGSMVSPAAMAGLLGTSGLYTQAGQKAVTPLMAGGSAWRVPLRKAIESQVPLAGLLGAAGGMQVMQ